MWARLVDLFLPLVLAGIVSYATSVFALQRQMDVLEERQVQQFQQLRESIDHLRQDLRDWRQQGVLR